MLRYQSVCSATDVGSAVRPAAPLDDELVENRCEILEFVQVCWGQPGQARLAISRQPYPGDPAVLFIPASLHESGSLGPVDQLDGAVVTEQKVTSEVAHRRALRPGVTLDRKQQLMLGWGQTHGARLSLAPVQEAPQASSERQQVLVVFAGQLRHIRTPRRTARADRTA